MKAHEAIREMADLIRQHVSQVRQYLQASEPPDKGLPEHAECLQASIDLGSIDSSLEKVRIVLLKVVPDENVEELFKRAEKRAKR